MKPHYLSYMTTRVQHRTTDLIPRTTRRTRATLALSGLLLAIVLTNLTFSATTSSNLRRFSDAARGNHRRRTSTKIERWGTVHTFFDGTNGEDGGAGVRDEDGNDDALVLALWKDQWNQAGYDTIVLTMDNAKRHPRFEEIQQRLKTLEANVIAAGNEVVFDASSFYRWMAMASAGGGLMSTYDTFPINYHHASTTETDAADLPHGGTLTSFEAHVPSLLSGTDNEYQRVLTLLLDTVPQIPLGSSITDENALQILRSDGTHGIHFFFPPDYVQHGFAYLTSRVVDCGAMARVRAVHLSKETAGDAVASGLYPVVRTGDGSDGGGDRAEACRIFLHDWADQCDGMMQEETFVQAPVMPEEMVGQVPIPDEGTTVQVPVVQEETIVQSPVTPEETTATEETTVPRPVMHTFFPFLPYFRATNPRANATTPDERLLILWNEEWTNAGFDIVVLTPNDAMGHPNFAAVQKKVGPWIGGTSFYRWLAMAAVGGGWMSTYDTFPTNFPVERGSQLPNDGNFVSYLGTTPALVAGTALEWERVLYSLIDAVPRIVNLPDAQEHTVTDVHAFHVLCMEKDPTITFVKSGAAVQDGFLYSPPTYDNARPVDCRGMSVGSAVHLSTEGTRRAIEDGVYPIKVEEGDKDGREGRADGARVFLGHWKAQCKGYARH